jgi:hypothetical protein
LRGARKPRPPHGWDDAHPEPAVGWRQRKEKFGALADPDEPPPAAPPALRFLQRAQWAEPSPAKKPLQQPTGGRGEPFHGRPSVTSAAVKQKHFRERVKAGKCVLKVECESHAIEALLEDAGLLTPAKDAARTEVEAAVERLLALLIADHTAAIAPSSD